MADPISADRLLAALTACFDAWNSRNGNALSVAMFNAQDQIALARGGRLPSNPYRADDTWHCYFTEDGYLIRTIGDDLARREG